MTSTILDNLQHIASLIATFFTDVFLTFDSSHPLLFTQFNFWAFFALVFALFALTKNKILLRNAFLFFVSLFFYYKTSGLFVFILIFTTLYGYFIAIWMAKAKRKFPRKLWLSIGVILNLGVLCYFKYAYFFTDAYKVYQEVKERHLIIDIVNVSFKGDENGEACGAIFGCRRSA